MSDKTRLIKTFAILESVRPRQWHKNCLVLIVPVAGGVNVFTQKQSLVAITIMILASSIIYVINDFKDIAFDRIHPTKRYRPLASGRISKKESVALLLITALLLSIALSKIDFRTTCVVLSYLVIQSNYSFWAKNVPVLEIVLVSSGFLIRVMVGASLFQIAPSVFLLGATTSGALSIVVSKRLSEAMKTEDNSLVTASSRRVLKSYQRDELKAFLTLSCSVFIMFFSLWAFEETSNIQIRYIRGFLVLPVLVGTLRVMSRSLSGDLEAPERELFTDRLLLGTGAISCCLFVVSIWMN
jgi:decaprenyl-phosphate phosphoribosyltransferase